jgi:hypothetical protein
MAIPAPFGLTTSGSSLGDNYGTLFTSSAVNQTTNLTAGSIFEIPWKVPSTSLSQFLDTLSTTVPSSGVSIITTTPQSTSLSFQVPSMSISAQYSTFIYTKDVPITISAAAEQASVQIWYSS